MRAVTAFGVFAGLLISATTAVGDDTWNLVFQDDFNRTELGDQWHKFSPSQTAEIRDGRLFMDGHGGMTLLIDREFKPDVKLEFTAMPNPDAPPCDLSATLAANKFTGYWYLFGFGAGNNQFNHIIGPGVHVRDHDPKHLIEEGKTYHLTAVKEGNHLSYYVNGDLIVEADADNVLGGPGFDYIGLITWNGMYVDDVKAYERKTPAPNGPVIITEMPEFGFDWSDRTLTYHGDEPLSDTVQQALELYNRRDYRGASDLLFDAEPSVPGGVVLAYVLGDLGYECRVDDRGRLVKLVKSLAEAEPDNAALQRFSITTDWFSRITNRSRDRVSSTRLMVAGRENNPYYYKAKLYLARFHFASALEGGDHRRRKEAMEMFSELKEICPEHRGLREITGERVPWGEELIRDESEGPAWARYLQEAMARQQAILNWWAEVRQASDGQLGGGWGDDVELLRTWVPATCITTACERAVAGIERLSQGVWDNVLEKGYDRGISDVEHGAEPGADTLPTMMLLRYGDPKWVEYNLRSAKTIRESFMGINKRGYLQFLARDFGMGGVVRNFQGGGDTGYHARAMKHFIWLAWRGLPEAKTVFLQWCDMWHDLTVRQIGTKIAGFPPPTVWFPEGSIFPPNGATWYDERTASYGFPGLSTMVFDSFLTGYYLSGNQKYIDAVDMMMTLATKGPLPKNTSALQPDDPLNQQAVAAHMATRQVTAVYRRLTGQRVYDEYTLRSATPTQRYQIQRDLDQYRQRFEHIAKGLRYNWTRFTSEVLQTDRAGLAAAADVMGAYTGAVTTTRDAYCPTFQVTYDTPSLNFAALVLEGTPGRLRVMLYNFEDEPMPVGIRPWELTYGVYALKAGEPVPGEREGQNRYTWSDPIDVRYLRRATPIRVEVPSRKEWVVDLRLREPIDRPELLPDLAVHARDVKMEDEATRVTVHNIGGAAAGAFDVVLEAKADGGFRELARVAVDGLPAIEHFEPVRREVKFDVPSDRLEEGYRVRIDPDEQVDELYELNNSAVLP